MRYVAAYLLAGLGGNSNPNATDIEKILSSVGIEVDKDKLKKRACGPLLRGKRGWDIRI
ncbi:60S acidic ribosomal protein P2-like [Tropilaelaps mercedesae]|uniref:Large ribosomal subunit protein P2 n=1 Tax=Tropilaelaps mercedesae TaxID=418985 RepID=A0A1V9X7D3_9ACAR|nr:60S acidic ribosomal protein P2-like [Tropilaelaps mercedesae]